ncbi:MAG TPA: carbohydrate kinase family protein [Atribacteraceae bacterium]|nr:carbohydrate kinase family protein [Atribacteraceae bacterium]
MTCCGILVADLLGRPIERFPEKGRLALVPEMELHAGGGAHNTGVILSKLGVETAVIGKVGRDDLGEFLLNTLKRQGIDTRGIAITEEFGTSATMVIVDGQGERTFLHYTGANRALRADDVRTEFFSGSKILHISGTFLMPGIDGEGTAQVFRRAQEQGILTTLDTYWDDTGRWLPVIEPCLSHLDIFISNRDESSAISGRMDLVDNARFFLDYGIKTVAIKMGNEGSFIMTAEDKILVPPFVVETVDGSGAGDAFSAGFLVGVLKGWDFYRTGRFANACGALCVQKIGATQGVGSHDAVDRFIHDYDHR